MEMKCFPSKPLRAANDMLVLQRPDEALGCRRKGGLVCDGAIYYSGRFIKGNSHLVAQRVKTLVASKYLLFELSCIIQTYYKAKDV